MPTQVGRFSVATDRGSLSYWMQAVSLPSPPKRFSGKRLHDIYTRLTELLWTHTPDTIAIERVFHNKNVSSSLTTAAVIGICQLTAELAGRPSDLFTPQQVKAAVCGHGGAEKPAVKKFVERLTGVPVKNAHTTDATATAIAGLLHN